jgi:Flp pilus assembly protein TadB
MMVWLDVFLAFVALVSVLYARGEKAAARTEIARLRRINETQRADLAEAVNRLNLRTMANLKSLEELQHEQDEKDAALVRDGDRGQLGGTW